MIHQGTNYTLENGDCIRVMHRLKKEGKKFPLAIFSPPFANLLAYSENDSDMGNSRDDDDAFHLHFGFFAHALFGVMEPDANVCLHIQQIVRRKSVHGHMGLYDIRGHIIRLMIEAGFVFYGETTIWKDPQAQSIRTKAHRLQFSQFNKNSMVSAPALADYLLIFKMPGENKRVVIPSKNGLDNNAWIEWASPVWNTNEEPTMYPASCWFDIRETACLNNRATVDEVIGAGHKTSETKWAHDERHMCPLQVDLVRRCVLLWSNVGDEILTPFAGIGTELVMPLIEGRRAYGIELNPNYVEEAIRNCDGAERKVIYDKSVLTLF